ncbi:MULTISPECIES: nucleotidyltransferase domain-containing protein [Parachlamydia]|nr:nucleotidyltransferase domain-containing protein [Parachlamydia acanthamoebae]
MMEDSKSIIKTKIEEIEKEQNIHILFACESGSRAWGFPSPDSDFDVRFIYKHPKTWYLSLREESDVLDFPINSILDINGWDLKKALRLLIKHNAILYEWIQSPIVYVENTTFKKGFAEISTSCFSQIATMHHYLSSSKKYYEKCISENMVKLKTYFYCLRSTLAALWLHRFKTIPPMELHKLMDVINEKKLLIEKIHVLLQLKATQNESYLHPRETDLNHFFYETISLCESTASSLPKGFLDYKVLNTFFQNTIEG